MSRKLASIRRVLNILPIEGADSIEVAQIDGWQCVVKKGEFKAGDLCVYFEIDSLLPMTPAFEFLRARGTKRVGDKEGYRLKTIKLKGTLSQGLALPVSAIVGHVSEIGDFYEGDDVTDYVGVIKYEPPASKEENPLSRGSGTSARNFPSFVPKTDQERIQNLYGTYSILHADTKFEVTLKLDGSSMTVYHHNGKYGVCSRNYDLSYTTPGKRLVTKLKSWWSTLRRWLGLIDPNGSEAVRAKNTFIDTATSYELEPKLKNLGMNIALQGELMGPGIQKNREQFESYKYFIFDVYLIDEKRYATPFERYDILNKLGLMPAHVPIVNGEFEAFRILQTLEDFLKLADTKSLVHPIAEGVVFKSLDGKVSFKAINNKYLLKCEE